MDKVIQLAWKNVGRKKHRSLLLLLAIVFATCIPTIVFPFFLGMNYDIIDNVKQYQTGDFRIRTAQFNQYEDMNPLFYGIKAKQLEYLYDYLEHNEYVTQYAAHIMFTGMYEYEKNLYSLHIATIPDTVDVHNDKALLIPHLLAGSFAQKNTEIMISKWTADRYNIAIGDRITILTQTMQRFANARTFEVTGIISYPIAEYNTNKLVMLLSTAQDFLLMPQQVSEIVVQTKQKSRAVIADIQTVHNNYVNTKKDFVPLDITPWYNIGITGILVVVIPYEGFIIGLIFFILGAAIIINTQMMVIWERRSEFIIMHALGMPITMIRRLFIIESLYVVGIGTILGIIIGSMFVYIFAQGGWDVSSFFPPNGESFGMTNVLYPQMPWWLVVLVFVLSMSVGYIAALLPTRRIAKLSICDILR